MVLTALQAYFFKLRYFRWHYGPLWMDGPPIFQIGRYEKREKKGLWCDAGISNTTNRKMHESLHSIAVD